MAEVSLGARASRGATNTLLWQLVRIATQLASTILLTRLLSPDDFGLIAMVTALVGIGEIIRDFGLTTAAVQAKSLSKDQKSNLFWINAGIGTVLTAVIFLCAPLIALFYDQQQLTQLAQALSVTFLLNGLSTQFRAELNRRMRFLALNASDTIPPILGLGVGIALAIATGSVWALVAQQVSTALLGLVMVIAVARWWPGMPNARGSIRNLLRFGGGVVGTQAVAYVTKNIDNVSIGFVWGASALGLYSRAYQLLMAPIVQILAPMTRVAMPILSRLQDDRERFMRFLRRGQLVGSLLAGSLYATALGLANPIVLLLFGSDWVMIVPIFQALAVGGIFRAMNQVSYWAYLALGLSGAQFRFYLISQPLIVVALLAGLPWGPVGVAVAHSAAYAINWFASLWWCGRITGLDMKPLVRDGLRNTALVTLPIALLNLVAATYITTPLLAIATGLLATATFFAVSYFLVQPTRRDIRAVVDVAKLVRKSK